MTDNNKIIIADYVINSLNNGADDEDIKEAVTATYELIKTIKNKMDKYILLNDLKELTQ